MLRHPRPKDRCSWAESHPQTTAEATAIPAFNHRHGELLRPIGHNKRVIQRFVISRVRVSQTVSARPVPRQQAWTQPALPGAAVPFAPPLRLAARSLSVRPRAAHRRSRTTPPTHQPCARRIRQSIQLRLCPCDDERAPKARSHCPKPASLLFRYRMVNKSETAPPVHGCNMVCLKLVIKADRADQLPFALRLEFTIQPGQPIECPKALLVLPMQARAGANTLVTQA